VINYWARSSDNLLVGKFMGSDALGIYSRAYSLMLMPFNQVINVIAPVMFPVFSTIQRDRERVRRAFLRVIRLMTFITFPMMLGLLVVAEPFVLGLLGAKWSGVIPLIQILAVVGMTQTLCNPTGWIYASQGRTDWMFWWGVGGSGFLILAIVVGVLCGSVKTVALAYLFGNLIITAPCLAIPGRLIDMKLQDIWQAIRGNLLCTVVMGGCVWLIGRVLPQDMASLFKLAVQVPAGILVYAALAYASRQPVWGEIADIRNHFASPRQEAV
jgi:PST family polysaccharide transporter